MKIIGSHDELLLLKLDCQKRAECGKCALQSFCTKKGTSSKTTFKLSSDSTIYQWHNNTKMSIYFNDEAISTIDGGWSMDIVSESEEDILSPLDLFTLEKFKPVLIGFKKGDSDDQEDKTDSGPDSSISDQK